MASHTAEQGGNAASKAVERAKDMAASAATSARDAVNPKRQKVADALDNEADTVDEKGTHLPEPAKRHSRTAKDKLHGAADYVRDTDAEEMGRDAMHAATAYPVASLLILGAVVIGGSLLVAAMMTDDGPTGSEQSRPKGLSSAAAGLGPKGTETLSRIRDAAFGFLLARAVDTVEEMLPGFRDHYDRV